jgi:hypothetical protein
MSEMTKEEINNSVTIFMVFVMGLAFLFFLYYEALFKLRPNHPVRILDFPKIEIKFGNSAQTGFHKENYEGDAVCNFYIGNKKFSHWCSYFFEEKGGQIEIVIPSFSLNVYDTVKGKGVLVIEPDLPRAEKAEVEIRRGSSVVKKSGEVVYSVPAKIIIPLEVKKKLRSSVAK